MKTLFWKLSFLTKTENHETIIEKQHRRIIQPISMGIRRFLLPVVVGYIVKFRIFLVLRCTFYDLQEITVLRKKVSMEDQILEDPIPSVSTNCENFRIGSCDASTKLVTFFRVRTLSVWIEIACVVAGFRMILSYFGLKIFNVFVGKISENIDAQGLRDEVNWQKGLSTATVNFRIFLTQSPKHMKTLPCAVVQLPDLKSNDKSPIRCSLQLVT